MRASAIVTLYRSASRFRFLSMASFTAWPIVIDSPRKPALNNISANVRFMTLHLLLPETFGHTLTDPVQERRRDASGWNRSSPANDCGGSAWIRRGREELDCGD